MSAPTAAAECLSGLIEACQPQSLLVCGQLAQHLGQSWHQAHPDTRVTVLTSDTLTVEHALSRPYDVALITETLEHHPQKNGALLLGQLRNYGTHQIAVLVADSDRWQFQDFIGLGFKRLTQFESQPPLTLYTYNISNYNHKRDWNNARFWANPEMWDKARW
ncbi:DUF6231 family protein [Marinobacter caseinilyticus]|uniref:DUF6231 family protein n=1 Tax=Marinobacter caseinilyticus TaxID=2692195 RepID=UPI00140E186C|nr:DUF6231 family protein [Marinobacter caseinilyticus]